MSDNILLLAEDGNYLITENGEYIIAVVQYLTTALNGSYAIAGQTANILKSKSITLSYGSYSVTGQSADFVKGRVFTALNGDYSIVGNSATISYVSNAQLYIELRSFTERRRI